jgi:hypothetical protein
MRVGLLKGRRFGCDAEEVRGIGSRTSSGEVAVPTPIMLSLSSKQGTGTLLSELVCDAFAQGTQGLFEYATQLPAPEHAASLSVVGQTWAGVVGFTASELRGSLVVNMNEHMVVNSLPAEVRARVSSDLSDPTLQRTLNDWCGEVANQIVGRAKNRIAGYGPLLTMSSPISLRASGMVWGGSSSTHEFRQRLEYQKGQLLSIASVTIERDHLVEKIPANSAASEGEMMMF